MRKASLALGLVLNDFKKAYSISFDLIIEVAEDMGSKLFESVICLRVKQKFAPLEGTTNLHQQEQL